MDFIDNQGRIFGVINVLDALVLVLVGIVVIAGASMVLRSGSHAQTTPSTGTEVAVLDLGRQPESLAEHITPGDSYAPAAGSNLTVRNVSLAPGDGRAHVLLGVTLTGPIAGSRITYDGGPIRIGRTLTVETTTYRTSGVVLSVGKALRSNSTKVLVDGTTSVATARAIHRGDTFTVAGNVVARVESVERFATRDPDSRTVFLGLSLDTVDLGEGPQFGAVRVRPGQTLPFQTNRYSFTGTVRRVGTTEQRGRQTTRQVTLVLSQVPPYIANAVRPGMTETTDGATVARVLHVDRAPSTIVVAGSNGSVYRRPDPTGEDVTISAELTVRETATGVTFKGRTIQRGTTIALDLGNVTVEPTVTSLRG